MLRSAANLFFIKTSIYYICLYIRCFPSTPLIVYDEKLVKIVNLLLPLKPVQYILTVSEQN